MTRGDWFKTAWGSNLKNPRQEVTGSHITSGIAPKSTVVQYLLLALTLLFLQLDIRLNVYSVGHLAQIRTMSQCDTSSTTFQTKPRILTTETKMIENENGEIQELADIVEGEFAPLVDPPNDTSSWRTLVGSYAQDTTMHGIKYLTSDTRPICRRYVNTAIIWIILLILN